MIPKSIILIVPEDNSKSPNRVQQVKSIRLLTGCTLKDAVAIIDAPGKHMVTLLGGFERVEVFGSSDPVANYNNVVRGLIGAGIQVTEDSETLMSRIHRLVEQAMEERNYSVAADLIAILNKNC